MDSSRARLQPLASALSSIFSELGAKALAAGTLPTQSSSAEQNVPRSRGLAFRWGRCCAPQGPAPCQDPRFFPVAPPEEHQGFPSRP